MSQYTLVNNGDSSFTLPAPFYGVLQPGASITLEGTPDGFLTACVIDPRPTVSIVIADRVLPDSGTGILDAFTSVMQATAAVGDVADAGKLFKLDAAGLVDGRDPATDGTKLDGFKAIATVTVASGQTVGTTTLPTGWANGNKVFASIGAKGANDAYLVECKCTGGNIQATVSTDPGVGGCTIWVLRTGL